MEQAHLDSTGELEPAVLNLTFIAHGSALPLSAFSTVLSATLELLDAIGSGLLGTASPVWGLGTIVPGHSEYSDVQRISVEFVTAPEGVQVADCLLAGIQQLRTTPERPTGFGRQALNSAGKLSRSLNAGVRELWFSRPGDTPAYLTASTLENLEALGY